MVARSRRRGPAPSPREQLVGLYPGTTVWSPAARDAAVATLTGRGDESSGWSVVWKAILWARLGRGDRAADVMNLLFRRADRLEGPSRAGCTQISSRRIRRSRSTPTWASPRSSLRCSCRATTASSCCRRSHRRWLTAGCGVWWRGRVWRSTCSWSGGLLVEARLRARAGGAGESLRIRCKGVELSRDIPLGGELVLRAQTSFSRPRR